MNWFSVTFVCVSSYLHTVGNTWDYERTLQYILWVLIKNIFSFMQYWNGVCLFCFKIINMWFPTNLWSIITPRNLFSYTLSISTSFITLRQSLFPLCMLSLLSVINPLLLRGTPVDKVRVPSLRQSWNNGAVGLVFITATVKVPPRFFDVGGSE